MNLDIARIALMYVLPLGITFTTILQTAASYSRTHKIAGAFISVAIVVMDCMFYFAKNSYVSYNIDGGMLLSFASLFMFGLLNIIRGEDLANKFASIFFSIFMMSGFIGIAYQERPTLLITSAFTPAEIEAQNKLYQDYIQSFQTGEGGKWIPAPKTANRTKGTVAKTTASGEDSPEVSLGRLEHYINETSKVIDRMSDIMNAIDNYEPIAPNISETEREKRGSQALAINNNATSISKKALGLFHPHEASEVHKELIQASESLRLAAYSLYTYSLQEDSEEQMIQYKQTRSQIAQTKIYLERFGIGLRNIISNNKHQPEEEQ